MTRMQMENWIAASAAVQAVATIILVMVTIAYVRHARAAAEAAEEGISLQVMDRAERQREAVVRLHRIALSFQDWVRSLPRGPEDWDYFSGAFGRGWLQEMALSAVPLGAEPTRLAMVAVERLRSLRGQIQQYDRHMDGGHEPPGDYFDWDEWNQRIDAASELIDEITERTSPTQGGAWLPVPSADRFA